MSVIPPAFTPDITKLVLTGTPVPFTRLTPDRNVNPPYWSGLYNSLFGKVADQGRDLALDALNALYLGGPERSRIGQNSEALLASGLSASGIRVPEVDTGSLVSVSL